MAFFNTINNNFHSSDIVFFLYFFCCLTQWIFRRINTIHLPVARVISFDYHLQSKRFNSSEQTARAHLIFTQRNKITNWIDHAMAKCIAPKWLPKRFVIIDKQKLFHNIELTTIHKYNFKVFVAQRKFLHVECQRCEGQTEIDKNTHEFQHTIQKYIK